MMVYVGLPSKTSRTVWTKLWDQMWNQIGWF